MMSSIMSAIHITKNGPMGVFIKDWHPGDPFPRFGKAVSNDNETELITTFKPIPELVVAGFYNPIDRTCYYVYPDGIDAWYKELHRQKVMVYMFNAAFDIPTAETQEVYAMLDEDLIMDVGINYQIHNIATKGDIAFDCLSLKGCAAKVAGMELDKGEEKGDEAARVTFHRDAPLTDEQREYLSGDLLSTYLIGDAFLPQPTVFLQTKADLVLATMTRNGQLIDKEVWGALRAQVTKEMNEAKEKLESYGFPFPNDPNANDPKDIFFGELSILGVQYDSIDNPSKGQIRKALLQASRYYKDHAMESTDKYNAQELASVLITELSGNGKLSAADSREYKAFMESIEALAFDTSKAQKALYPVLTESLRTLKKGSADPEVLKTSLDDHVYVLEKKSPVGPVKFLQDYIERLLMEHPNLELETTEKSGRVRISKTDKWRLDDANVKSEFLEAYMDYKHNEKLLSTYLKPEYIKEDGKIHPHFNVLVRTGRTSSGGFGSLNFQNLPSRGGLPLRNMFTVPKGWVCVQSDYSSIEMAGLAQYCYSTFGFSRLRDIINSGICPHFWFAGVYKGLIKPEDVRTDPEYVSELMAYLKDNVSKTERQVSKVANFGLPGGLSTRVLYKQMRIAGIHIEYDEVDKIRNQWFAAFPETAPHMKPNKMPPGEAAKYSNLSYRLSDDGEEELNEDVGVKGLNYYAVNLSGRKRNRCSYTSALNYVFQATVADGTKHAMWELYKMGMGPYLLGFVHDEFDYMLPMTHVKQIVPQVESAMIRGMAKIIKDVTVRVETTINRHWDKSGVVFPEATYDETGRIIVPECAYVEALRNPDKSGAEQPQ